MPLLQPPEVRVTDYTRGCVLPPLTLALCEVTSITNGQLLFCQISIVMISLPITL